MHHEYAASTHMFIDRPMGRIVVTYEIDLKPEDTNARRQEYLTELLNFVYGRLAKLDQERQYVRYYSELLAPFKATEAKLNFHCGRQVLDVDMLPLRLRDAIVVPGTETKRIAAIDGAYAVDRLVPRLIGECPGERNP